MLELAFQGQYRTRGVAFADRRRDRHDALHARRRRLLRRRDAGHRSSARGADVVNVQGTSAVDQRLAGRRRRPRLRLLARRLRPRATARPTSRATSNALAGTLNLDLGAGRHTLMISDEAATAGDTDVRITRGAGTTIAITGLAAGTITYTATRRQPRRRHHDLDRLGRRHDLRSTRRTCAPGVRTVTLLNTGLGNDTVTVDLDAGRRRHARARHAGRHRPRARRQRRRRRLGRRRRHHARARPAWVDHNGTVGLLDAPQPGSIISVTSRSTRRSAPTASAHERLLALGFDLKAGDVVTATVNGIAVAVLAIDASTTRSRSPAPTARSPSSPS